MSKTKIPPKVTTALWVRAGGRCEYRGCNDELWEDNLTLAQMNRAYVAHIVADEPTGPRGDPQRSKMLAKDLSNLMLLCDTHHRLIDKEQVAEHPEPLLLEMKAEHETRIETLTAIQVERRTRLLVLQANIGDHKGHVALDNIRSAVLPAHYGLRDPLTIDLSTSALSEKDPGFWDTSARDIERQVQTRVAWKNGQSVEHISVFALAPMPLLMVLGRALGDKTAADIYQRHRDTQSWAWPSGMYAPLSISTVEPDGDWEGARDISIELSISDAIPATAIGAALPDIRVAAYALRAPKPSPTLVRAPQDVRDFGTTFQSLMSRIRSRHGEHCTLHMFPAIPVSLAVQLGRALLPKARAPIRVYDYDAKRQGFSYALTL